MSNNQEQNPIFKTKLSLSSLVGEGRGEGEHTMVTPTLTLPHPKGEGMIWEIPNIFVWNLIIGRNYPSW